MRHNKHGSSKPITHGRHHSTQRATQGLLLRSQEKSDAPGSEVPGASWVLVAHNGRCIMQPSIRYPAGTAHHLTTDRAGEVNTRLMWPVSGTGSTQPTPVV